MAINIPETTWLFLFVIFTLPLASLALATTIITVTALTLRVTIVYFEMALSLVHDWFNSRFKVSSEKPNRPHSLSLTKANLHIYPKCRGQRLAYPATINSYQNVKVSSTHPKQNDSCASLMGTISSNRDFEGVGGWEMSNDSDDECLWMKINCRLELPIHKKDRRRRHQCSHTKESKDKSELISHTHVSYSRLRKAVPSI